MLAGPIPGSRLTVALGYVQYTDRTFDVRTSDTVPLGGDLIAVDDRVRSEGGVVDVRMAVAYDVSPRVWLGIGAHVLSGATREAIVRVFGELNRHPDTALSLAYDTSQNLCRSAY